MNVCIFATINKPIFMKKIALFSALILGVIACKNNTNQPEGDGSASPDTLATKAQMDAPPTHYYGDTITAEGAVEAQRLSELMGQKDSLQVKVAGTINSSCSKKGCWMKMDLGKGQEMRISFKDYGFFVPKNLNGEKAIVDGYAHIDTLDVPYLRHLAEDAGKSKEEIEAINEPEISLNYVAHGVILKG